MLISITRGLLALYFMREIKETSGMTEVTTDTTDRNDRPVVRVFDTTDR